MDEEAANESMYGDSIARGGLTCALSARLLVTEYMNENATLGGTGRDEIRWQTPVYVGDTLSIHVELVDKMPGYNPRFGYTNAKVTTTNQRNEEVLTTSGLGLTEKRP